MPEMMPEYLPGDTVQPKTAEDDRNIAGDGDGGGEGSSGNSSRWKTDPEQRGYTQRLVKALRSVGRSAPPVTGVSRSFVVKEAADSALAMAAKGRSRWSRAILSKWRRRSERFVSTKFRRVSVHWRAVRTEQKLRSPTAPTGSGIYRTPAKRKRPGGVTEDAGVDDRLKTLGNLIPGGKNLAAPALLDEATDYIAALEMQVKAMSALADLLSASTRT